MPIGKCMDVAREAFSTGRTKNIQFRLKQLKNLLRFLDEQADQIVEVLSEDIKKPPQESLTCEVQLLENDLRHTMYELKEWAKPERPSKRLIYLLDGLYIYNDPYGVVLIIGSWNYPVLLSLGPLIGKPVA